MGQHAHPILQYLLSLASCSDLSRPWWMVASIFVWLALFLGPVTLFYITYREDIRLRMLWHPLRHILHRRHRFNSDIRPASGLTRFTKLLTPIRKIEEQLMGETIFVQAVVPLLILSVWPLFGLLSFLPLSVWTRLSDFRDMMTSNNLLSAFAISLVVVYRAVRLEKLYAVSCPESMRALFNIYHSPNSNWPDHVWQYLDDRGLEMKDVEWVKDANQKTLGKDCLEEGGQPTKAQFPLQVTYVVRAVKDEDVESFYDVITYDFHNSTAAFSVTKTALVSTVFNACSISAIRAANKDSMRDSVKELWGCDSNQLVSSVLAPGVWIFGLPGLMVANFLSHSLATLLVAAKVSRSATQVRASIAGLGIISHRMTSATQGRISTSEVNLATFNSIEAFASNFLKTSALMSEAAGAHGFETKSFNTLCFSIGFSLLLGAYSMIKTLFGGLKSDDYRVRRLAYLTVVCYLLTAATTCRRLYIVFACPSHAGGLLGGCLTKA